MSNSNDSLKITLEESRISYDREERLFDSIENKASFIVTVNGILIAFIGSRANFFSFFHSIFFILISLLFSLAVYFLRPYQRPHKKYRDYYSYVREDKEKVLDQFLLNYIKVLDYNERNNKNKMLFLKWSFYSLIVGFITFIISFLIVLKDL